MTAGLGDQLIDDGEWITLHRPSHRVRSDERSPSIRRILTQVAIMGALVLVIVGLAGAALSRRLAEQQSVHDVARLTDVIAEGVFRPILTDAMATDTAATAVLDLPVRRGVLSDSLVRVKLWSPAGKIMYSDEMRLIGEIFDLDDEARASLTQSRIEASVSDLKRPENHYEQSQSKLLEVYRPIWTPSGAPMLLETYFLYDSVSARSHDLWRAFFGIMVSSLAAVLLLMLPLIWALVRRVRREQARRESALQRSMDASEEERRRIAADLHDGVVQQLAATSFTLAASAQRAQEGPDRALEETLSSAASTVRSAIAGLRSLLVDIYPASLSSAGLSAALHDLVGTMAGRGPVITLNVESDIDSRLDPDAREAIFRVAQESLRNAVRHADAANIAISVVEIPASPFGGERDVARLEVTDDGIGMPPASAQMPTNEGHFGLQLIFDVAVRSESTLSIRSAVGKGTTLRMDVPLT